MKFIQIVMFLYLCTMTMLHANTHPKSLDLSISHETVGNAMSMYEDVDGNMNISDVMQLPQDAFTPVGKPVSSNQFTSSAFWYTLDVHNATSSSLSRLMVVEAPWLNDIRFTIVSSSGETKTYQGGTNYPFESRSKEHFLTNFEHDFEPGYSKIYIRVYTEDPFIFLTSIMDASDYFFNQSVKSTFIGFIFGGITTVIIYFLFLYIAIRERYYIYYVITLCTFLFMNASYNGYTFMYIFADYPQVQSWIHSSAIYLFIITYIMFAKEFLEVQKNHKTLEKIGIFILGLIFFFGFSSIIFGGYQYYIIFSLVSIFLGAIYTLVIAIYAWLYGNRSARFFILGALSGTIGAVVTVASVLNYIPYSYLSYKASDFAMYLDVLLLSLALADRMKVVHQEKEIAQQKAKTDSLTGLLNLHSYFEVSSSEYQRIIRNNIPYSVVMIDIDNFKKVNDNYGHSVGDTALIKLAEILKSSVREYDYIFRRGGDEFILFLPETTQYNAHTLSQRIRERIEKTRIELDEGKYINITCSIGVSEIKEDDLALDAVVKRADKALYTSKNTKRNSVTLWTL